MDGDLRRLAINRRFADAPFTNLPWRCSRCGSRRVTALVMDP
jgi:hypothetical protein